LELNKRKKKRVTNLKPSFSLRSKYHQRASLLKRKKRALVVDGKTLVYILDKRANLQEDFLKLTSHCSSVLGCRATPLQKAYIVRIVKEELKMHTMAIGDGANDVSMIQVSRIDFDV
jgi:phospholipid-translocating ATPase